MPIAVIVPTIVETTVAITAHATVYPIDSIIVRLANIFSYHCSEKPVKVESDLELLKLNSTT